MKKGIKYAIWLIVLLFVAYNSVYFKKLDAVKASVAKTFDASAYAHNYLDKTLPPIVNNAPEIDVLIGELKTSPAGAFTKYSHALAIGSTGFFMVKGQGKIVNMDENDVYLTTDASHTTIKIATAFVFGNAVRDASGLIKINDFASTMDLNNVSAEIDKIIRQQVVPTFKAKAKPGDHIEFTGAIELNSSHLNLADIEVMPVSLKIIP